MPAWGDGLVRRNQREVKSLQRGWLCQRLEDTGGFTGVKGGFRATRGSRTWLSRASPVRTAGWEGPSETEGTRADWLAGHSTFSPRVFRLEVCPEDGDRTRGTFCSEVPRALLSAVVKTRADLNSQDGVPAQRDPGRTSGGACWERH